MIVAFLGHSYTIFTEELRQSLKEKILQTINEYDDVEFYLGGYGNFDYGCLEILTELKKEHLNIKRTFITPYISSDYYKLKNGVILFPTVFLFYFYKVKFDN